MSRLERIALWATAIGGIALTIFVDKASIDEDNRLAELIMETYR